MSEITFILTGLLQHGLGARVSVHREPDLLSICHASGDISLQAETKLQFTQIFEGQHVKVILLKFV